MCIFKNVLCFLNRIVLYCAPMLDPDDAYIDSLKDACSSTGKRVVLYDKIPDLQEIKRVTEGDRVLLVADDLFGFRGVSDYLTALVTAHSHHVGISCLFACQNPFMKSKDVDMVTLTRQLTGRFLLESRSDMHMIRTLNQRLFPERPQYLSTCLTRAQELYSMPYVYINTTPQTALPRRYMVYTCLFADERRHGSPIFFDLAQK